MKESHLLGLVLFIGIMLRLMTGIINPSNNTFDDHLEVVHLYAETMDKPDPDKCWECYQPPVYYTLSGTVLRLSRSVGLPLMSQWKSVQLINTGLSILLLFLGIYFMRLFGVHIKNQVLVLSFLAVLPRDIYTSSIISNDYLLLVSTLMSTIFFIKTHKSLNEGTIKEVVRNFTFLGVFVTLGALTKQHGLILLLFPLILAIYSILKSGKSKLVLILATSLITMISMSDEIWKYQKTEKILVSNQHFFDYADGQFPGSLDKVEFTSLKIPSLLSNPWISEETSASFMTSIFARTFFDYEWRFLSPEVAGTLIIGRVSYLLGAIWLLFFLLTMGIGVYQRSRLDQWKPAFPILVIFAVGCLYMLVPMVQTFRFPYFSSMKAVFCLPGIILLLLLQSRILQTIKPSPTLRWLIISINLLYGLLFAYAIFAYISPSLEHIHGILWAYPG